MKFLILVFLILIHNSNLFSQNQKEYYTLILDCKKAKNALKLIHENRSKKIKTLEKMIKSINVNDTLSMDLISDIKSKKVFSCFINNMQDTFFNESISFKNKEDLKNLLLLKYKLENDIKYDSQDSLMFNYYNLLFSSNTSKIYKWNYEICTLKLDDILVNDSCIQDEIIIETLSGFRNTDFMIVLLLKNRFSKMRISQANQLIYVFFSKPT